MVLLAVFTLLQSPAKSFDIGGGLRATVSVDKASGEYELGSIVEFIRGKKLVDRTRIREMLDRWLASNNFWGGKEKANNLRYLDHPQPYAKDRIQGHVYEIVPAPHGCLIRVGVIDTSQSQTRVLYDVVFKWDSGRNHTQTHIDTSEADYYTLTPTVKLPRCNGSQFLVTSKAVYKLSGMADDIKKNLVVNLPNSQQGYVWVGLKVTGPTLWLMSSYKGKPAYERLNLLTGNLSAPTTAQLKAAGF